MEVRRAERQTSGQNRGWVLATLCIDGHDSRVSSAAAALTEATSSAVPSSRRRLVVDDPSERP